MSLRDATAGVHLPSLAFELGDGWTVGEGATISSPSGLAVSVRLHRAPEGLQASDLADQEERLARAALGTVDFVSTEARPMRGGTVGEQRQFTFDRDGVASVGRYLCAVDAGRALTVSAAWAADDEQAALEVERAMAGVFLLARPVASAGSEAERPADGPLPQRRDPLDVSVWSALGSRWAAAPADVVEVSQAGRWSAEELAVCATIVGVGSFPTVGPEVLAALPQVAADSTVAAVARSLLARGLLSSSDGDGSIALADDLGDWVEVAVYPDLTVSVERVGRGDGPVGWWFGVRPDAAVQVTVLPDGTRACGRVEPAHVVEHVVALVAGSGDEPAVARGQRTACSVTFDELTTGHTNFPTLVRVNTAWRVGEAIHGGAFGWAVDADGESWVAEEILRGTDTATAWRLEPVESGALRRVLLDHLPRRVD